MVNQVTTITPDGEKGLGLVPAPFNPKSLRYRLTPEGEQPAIDWGASPSLRPWLDDYVSDQGAIGSCVAHMAQYAIHVLRTLRGITDDRMSNRNFMYFWGRVLGGFMDADRPSTWVDSGMWAQAAFDVVLPGYPREELDPYVADAFRRPPDVLAADIPHNDDVLSHRGIFTSDPGGLAGGVILALQHYLPVGIGMLWRPDYNNPDSQGILPDVSAVGSNSAHEIVCYMRIAEGVIGRDWYGVCRQSWGRSYTQGRRFPIPEMIPGDFLIPGRRFSDGTVIDVRAASSELVPEPPTPSPTPDPERATWEQRANNMRTAVHRGTDPFIAERDRLNAEGYDPQSPEMQRALSALHGAEVIRNAAEHEYSGGA